MVSRQQETQEETKGNCRHSGNGDNVILEMAGEFQVFISLLYLLRYLHYLLFYVTDIGLPWWLSGKESACQCRRPEFDPCIRKIPWRRKWQLTLVFLPGKSHWTEKPGGLQSMESQNNWTRVSDYTTIIQANEKKRKNLIWGRGKKCDLFS